MAPAGPPSPPPPAGSEAATDLDTLRAVIGAVPDPEIPVLTIDDLGVLRTVEVVDGRIVVTITPTYSGCPAMRYIADQVEQVLADAGVEGEVRTVLSPAWTTDWMSAEGRAKLEAYGIAPPPPPDGQAAAAAGHSGGVASGPVAVSVSVPVALAPTVRCPRCRSSATELISAFGSTACKALYRCRDCLEPFDHFKRLQ